MDAIDDRHLSSIEEVSIDERRRANDVAVYARPTEADGSHAQRTSVGGERSPGSTDAEDDGAATAGDRCWAVGRAATPRATQNG